MKNNLLIYLVSLEQDINRREKLKKQFSSMYDNFIQINAIDGRKIEAKKYYDKIYNFFLKHKRIMLPAELGCTLSHVQALETFLLSGEDYALVIEDDVIGSDKDIETILTQMKFLDENSILFCGCQDGLMNRYKYGYSILNSNLLKVPNSIRGNFSRTAAYLVSKNVALDILKFHKNNYITIADYWFELLNKTNVNIYYLNIFKHPTDLSNSIIEEDRKKNNKSFLHKIFSKDIFRILYNRFINELKMYFHLTFGAKNIDKIK